MQWAMFTWNQINSKCAKNFALLNDGFEQVGTSVRLDHLDGPGNGGKFKKTGLPPAESDEIRGNLERPHMFGFIVTGSQ